MQQAQQFIIDYMKQEDALFLSTISDELYNSEYVIIGYSVTNAGVIYDAPIFTNDLEEDADLDTNTIYLVSEIYDDSEIIKEAL